MKKIMKDLAILGVGLSLMAMSGCQTFLEKTRNLDGEGMTVDKDGKMYIGNVSIQSVDKDAEAFLCDYDEDTALLSPSTKTHKIKITMTGAETTKQAPSVVKSICESFLKAKEAPAAE